MADALAGWEDGVHQAAQDADILPCLGARPIAEIEAPELVAMANAIQDRGARDIAKRALETVGQVFRYGIAHGYAKRNPGRGRGWCCQLLGSCAAMIRYHEEWAGEKRHEPHSLRC